MDTWLSLEVSRSDTQGPALYFVIPKKVVRLSTRRNRLKRLFREATRGDGFFGDLRVYKLRVRRDPGLATQYQDVKAEIERLKKLCV